MSRPLLSLLVHLAKIDGEVSASEIQKIHQLGESHGMTAEAVDEVIDSPDPVEIKPSLTDDQKFEYISTLVDLMKVDGKLYLEEIKFCSGMAAKLGYDEDVIYDLITEIYSDFQVNDKEWRKGKVQEYLKK